MKSKFEEFSDGIVKIYKENDDGKLEAKFEEGIRFGEENVSIQRHYAAQAADRQVDRVIHIPVREGIVAHDVAVIEGEQFDIEKVDKLKNTTPPILKLSLTMYEKHRKKEFA